MSANVCLLFRSLSNWERISRCVSGPWCLEVSCASKQLVTLTTPSLPCHGQANLFRGHLGAPVKVLYSFLTNLRADWRVARFAGRPATVPLGLATWAPKAHSKCRAAMCPHETSQAQSIHVGFKSQSLGRLPRADVDVRNVVERSVADRMHDKAVAVLRS